MKTIFLLASLVLGMTLLVPGTRAASAISTSPTADGYAYFWCTDEKDIGDAKNCAYSRCTQGASGGGGNPKECKVVASKPNHGWWAIYERSDGGLNWAFSRDRQMAIDSAYDSCLQQGHCSNGAAHVFSDGHLPEPHADTHLHRWRTVCDNAACTRTYSDGRRVEFTACVNPATGAAFDNTDGTCSGLDMSGLAFGQHRSGE